MSNLVEHARRELEIIGEDPVTVEGMLKVVQAFADMGHSGGSASVCIPVLNELLQFKNLAPLSDDPAEWHDHSDLNESPLWQNVRNGEAFSTDGGKTYTLLSEDTWVGEGDGRGRVRGPLHTSVAAEQIRGIATESAPASPAGADGSEVL